MKRLLVLLFLIPLISLAENLDDPPPEKTYNLQILVEVEKCQFDDSDNCETFNLNDKPDRHLEYYEGKSFKLWEGFSKIIDQIFFTAELQVAGFEDSDNKKVMNIFLHYGYHNPLRNESDLNNLTRSFDSHDDFQRLTITGAQFYNDGYNYKISVDIAKFQDLLGEIK